MENISSAPVIIGIALILVGALLWKFPPKEINSFYGYRTPSAMSSQRRWDFAQRFAGFTSFQTGAIVLIFWSLFGWLNLSDHTFNVICAILTAASIVWLIGRTEWAIRKKFPNP